MDVSSILLNGDPFPWVLELKLLGIVLQADTSMKVDWVANSGKFIGKVNSFLCGPKDCYEYSQDIWYQLLWQQSLGQRWKKYFPFCEPVFQLPNFLSNCVIFDHICLIKFHK